MYAVHVRTCTLCIEIWAPSSFKIKDGKSIFFSICTHIMSLCFLVSRNKPSSLEKPQISLLHPARKEARESNPFQCKLNELCVQFSASDEKVAWNMGCLREVDVELRLHQERYNKPMSMDQYSGITLAIQKRQSERVSILKSIDDCKWLKSKLEEEKRLCDGHLNYWEKEMGEIWRGIFGCSKMSRWSCTAEQ